MEDGESVVIDNGSYTCRAGFGGDDAPRSIFPPVVSSSASDSSLVGANYKDTYVGDEAQVRRDILYPKTPLFENGVVKNWDDMEKVWFHVFYDELRTEPEKHSVLISESPLNTSECRQRTAEVMFEKFGVPGF